MQALENPKSVRLDFLLDLSITAKVPIFIYINFIDKMIAPRKKEDQDNTVSAAERARNLFSVLDSDGNGVLDMDEFIAGRFELYQTI